MVNSVFSNVKKEILPAIISQFSTATTTDSMSFELTPRATIHNHSPLKLLNSSFVESTSPNKPFSMPIDEFLPSIVRSEYEQNYSNIPCLTSSFHVDNSFETIPEHTKVLNNYIVAPNTAAPGSINSQKLLQINDQALLHSSSSPANISVNSRNSNDTVDDLFFKVYHSSSSKEPMLLDSIDSQQFLTTDSSSKMADNIIDYHLNCDLAKILESNSQDNTKDYNIKPLISRRKVQYRKTRLCPWYFSGRCLMENNCNYAHSQSELRGRPDLSKTRICPKMEICTNTECRFAHYNSELRATGAFFRTKLCKYWQEGSCLAGIYCRHAHGLDQLREPEKERSENTSSKHFPNNRHSFADFQNELCSNIQCDRSTSEPELSSSTDILNKNIDSHFSDELLLVNVLTQLFLDQYNSSDSSVVENKIADYKPELEH